jgi:predicted ArsR family transcriptional regulator
MSSTNHGKIQPIYTWAKQNKSEITAERLEELAAKGITDYKELAKALGVMPQTVAKHLQRVSKQEAFERGKARYERSQRI